MKQQAAEESKNIATMNDREKENGSSGTLNAKPHVSTESLASRSRIPCSMYALFLLAVGAQYTGGIYRMEVLRSVLNSVTTSVATVWKYLGYMRGLLLKVSSGATSDPRELATAAVVTLCSATTLYVLIYVPFRAGMWTGRKSKRHRYHRYMGLTFLTLYFCAWVEFVTRYDEGGKDSYLAHIIGLIGVGQGVSAFFSFRVLPSPEDPGYLSDKAVLSRAFVHENVFFNFITFLGSCLYHDGIHDRMMSNPIGKVVLHIFGYWLYALIRPLFPTTSFSKAGSSATGRTEKNEQFYRIGTHLVKLFYLWAKYFLGYHLNWIVALGIASQKDMQFVRGLYLINVGTISISIFLHTLRFKKALPPTLTFSIYLGQLYCTFLALPFITDLFWGHKRLMALATLGLLVNMTRKRSLHVVWCALSVYLLECTTIDW